MYLDNKCFDYKGFNNKHEWMKDKLKSMIGKGTDETEILKRKKQLIEYYKSHPEDLRSKGKSESIESFKNKLKNKKSSSIVTRRSNALTRSIKDTGSKYTPGKYTNLSARVAMPLIAAPLPGTAVVGAGVIGAGSITDKAVMSRLKKNKKVNLADKRLRKLKKEIKLDDKLQNIQRKKLELKD